MKSKEEKDQAWAKMTLNEMNSLEALSESIKKFADGDGEISMDNYYQLTAFQKELDVAVEIYLSKVIHLLKSGHELD